MTRPGSSDTLSHPPSSSGRPDQPYDDEFDRETSGERRHLLDYIRVLHRRRWIALTTFVTVTVLGAVRTFSAPSIYEATAQLLIDTSERNVLFKDSLEQDRTTLDYAQTQHRLMRSRALAKQTLEALKLGDSALVTGTSTQSSFSLMQTIAAPLGWVTRSSTASKRNDAADASKTTTQAVPIDAFLGNLTIAPVRNSQLVDVKFRSSDPHFAALAANELVRQYMAQTQELKNQTSNETSDWLTQQLEEQRKKVEASELAIQRYREQNDAVSLDDSDNIVVQKLADLNAAVTKAKMARIEKESQFQQLQNASPGDELQSLPPILSNTFVQQLKSDLSALQAEQTQLGEKFGEKHPNMVKVASAIASAQAKLDAEMRKVVDSVRSEYLSAQAEEQSLIAALNAQKGDALAQNRKGIEYGALQRDAVTNRQLYEGLLQRTRETGISKELKASNVRIVDAAEVPRYPVLPRRQTSMLLAVLAAIVLAVGLAIFLDYLDNRIKLPEEIASHLGVPCLGIVPLVSEKVHGVSPLINNGVPANFAEAFKVVRTNVLFSSPEEGSRSLVVTSTGPGEGKTIVATNLAMALAQAGQRILLIDADMRRPAAHGLLHQSQEPGLSNLIVGNAKASATVRPSSVPGLWFLPSGRTPPNPAELLGSVRFKDFLITLRDHFDWVILDSPPVMAVTDAAVVAHLTNGVVFVVGSEMTNWRVARTAIDQLDTADGKLKGAILNRVDLQRNRYFYANYYRREYDSYHVAAS